jgi:hypothetical protein
VDCRNSIATLSQLNCPACRNSIAQLSQLNCPAVATQLPSHCPAIAQSLPSLSQLNCPAVATQLPSDCPAIAQRLPDGRLVVAPASWPPATGSLSHSPDFGPPIFKNIFGFQEKLGVWDPKVASTTSDKLHAYLTAMDSVAVDRRLPAGRYSVHNMDLGLADL